ncbi:MAG: 3-dehydroquinate synthase [Calditrichaeota bacterium]|nr:MAG: 3-dehydroquinate synthase [Calditrichota bacterium]
MPWKLKNWWRSLKKKSQIIGKIMKTIQVKTPGYTYPVYIGENILQKLNDLLQQKHKTRQTAVITSKNIDQLYGDELRNNFSREIQLVTLHVPDGETAKSNEIVQRLYTGLLENKFERSSLIIALGGGVVGDLAGFIAATYLRGISLVQVPTTILAQVDSSIGGKVGINHPLGKNLIGAFKQPLLVLADTRTLQTLPDAEVRCGLGEVIKYGFILDRNFFDYIDKNLEKALLKDKKVLRQMAEISAAAKADVVTQDEKEQNLRMILNYGHTFGHALETDLKFGTLKHGEAVILGIKCALQYQRLENSLSEEDYELGMRVLNRIPVFYDRSSINPEKLADRMLLDKKVKDGKIRLILLEKIGQYRIEPNGNREKIIKAFDILKN